MMGSIPYFDHQLQDLRVSAYTMGTLTCAYLRKLLGRIFKKMQVYASIKQCITEADRATKNCQDLGHADKKHSK